MNKILILKIAILVAIIAIVIVFALKPRSYKHMDRIAKGDLCFLLSKNKLDDKLKDFQRGTIKETEDKKAVIFTWTYKLDTSDTVVINIEVKKQVYPWENKRSDIYMNYKWGYLKKPNKNIYNAIPQRYKGDSVYVEHLILGSQNDDYLIDNDTLKLLIPTKKLFLFLKSGYFSVLQRYENYTIVEFYEPIALIKTRKKVTQTMSAKISFSDEKEVFIMPYNVPLELLDNLNKN